MGLDRRSLERTPSAPDARETLRPRSSPIPMPSVTIPPTRVLSFVAALVGSLLGVLVSFAAAQPPTGRIVGTVTLRGSSEPLHNVALILLGTSRATVTDDDGRYEFDGVAPGEYSLLAQREHLSDERRTVSVIAGETATSDFSLDLSGAHEHITVTASPVGAVSTFEAFNAVAVRDSFELAKNMTPTLGEALDDLPGVATRAFGPGSARPIIRGFDGDRVLIMQDGVRTGDLSSQSGDHGVSIDPASLERVEVVRGPATLLFGSNAIGGVVNAITPQEAYRHRPLKGLIGQATSDFGSANAQAGVNAGIQFGVGAWRLWGGGGSRRAGDYDTPDGVVPNSASRLANGRVGFGYFGLQPYFSVGYQVEDGRYGVPHAGESHSHGEEDEHAGEEAADELLIDLETQRQSVRVETGLRALETRAVESVSVVLNYLDWQHDEIETEDGVESLGTRFDNETFVIRAEVEQKRAGRLSGRLGVWGQFRDYVATGEEALAPPSTQQAFAVFGYEELDFGRARLQFGGRLEHNSFSADARDAEHGPDDGHDHTIEPPAVRDRTFTGLSASAGLHTALGAASAFVVNVSRTYRAPAIEELYNFGPHAGNQLFEVGNPDLERESALSFDVALRHRSTRFEGEVNGYYYHIDNFVFPVQTGEIEDGLPVGVFLQGDSRFVGFDARGEVELTERLGLTLGAGYVDAQLTETGESLPRIPPFRVTLGLEMDFGGVTVLPELVLAAEQDQTYGAETPTDGYSLLNVTASYLLARSHLAHQFAVRAYNLTNELYRRHTSFIKDLAPEMGRGIALTYSMRFF